MKPIVKSINATVSIELTERELLILNHICSYNLDKHIGMVSSYCTTELGYSISKDEVHKFIEDTRDSTKALMQHIDKTKLYSKEPK